MDDLPEEEQQHIDDQTAFGTPVGPGGDKRDNLERIERQLRQQRRRRHAARGGERPDQDAADREGGG